MSTHGSDNRQSIDGESSPGAEPSFYVIPELSQHLSLIQHLVDNSDLIPLVKGETGAGKSTAISTLQAQASESWLLCRLDANPMLHPDQLMVRLARFFGLPDASDDIRDRLIRHFESLREEGRLAVIIIDDAEQLPPASLIALMRLQEQRLGKSPICALVLFAQHSIERTLAMPQLQVVNLELFHMLDMPLLPREHVLGYLQHMLEQEGLTDLLLLVKPKIETLFSMSRGLPGRLTPLILQAINEGVPVSHTQSNRYSIGRVLAVSGIGLIVILMLLFQDKINQLFGVGDPEPQLLTLPAQRPIEAQIEPSQELIEPVQDEIKSALDYATLPEAESVAAEAEQEKLEEMALSTKENTADLGERSLEEIVPEIAPAHIAEALLEEEIIETKAPEAAEPLTTVSAGGAREGVEWAKRQVSSNFTLQLIGVGKLKSIEQFISMHGLKGDLYHIKMVRKGRPWYILLFGSYSDREAAKSGVIRDLPRALQKRGVWVRSFESIQKEFNE